MRFLSHTTVMMGAFGLLMNEIKDVGGVWRIDESTKGGISDVW